MLYWCDSYSQTGELKCQSFYTLPEWKGLHERYRVPTLRANARLDCITLMETNLYNYSRMFLQESTVSVLSINSVYNMSVSICTKFWWVYYHLLHDISKKKKKKQQQKEKKKKLNCHSSHLVCDQAWLVWENSCSDPAASHNTIRKSTHFRSPQVVWTATNTAIT